MSRKFLVPIVLPADPAAAMEAATKQYVDSKAGGSSVDEVWIGSAPSDPNIELWVDSSATNLTDPNVARWNSSWGVIGQSKLTTAFTTTAPHTTAQSTGLFVAVNETAGRRLRITVQTSPYPSGGDQTMAYQLQRNGVTIEQWYIPGDAVDPTTSFPLAHVISADAVGGVATYTVLLFASGANTSVSDFGAGTAPRMIMVEDAGPMVVSSPPPTLASQAITEGTWTPTISSLGTTQPAYGNSVVTAYYQRIGMWVSFEYYCAFGSTWNGGNGQIGIAAPFPIQQQPTIYCKLYMPSMPWDFAGSGYISAGIIRPLFAANATNSTLGGLSNANSTNTNGTGNPLTPGLYPMASPGSLLVNGRYRIQDGF